MDEFFSLSSDRLDDDGEGGLIGFMNRNLQFPPGKIAPLKNLTGSPRREREWGGEVSSPRQREGPGNFATDPNILRQAPANEERWRVSKQHRAEA